MFHPVTTEVEQLPMQISEVKDAILESGKNFIVIYPNNDLGCELIFKAYEQLTGIDRIKLFPSLRFEYFLTLLRNAEFVIGNSSAGIREAGIYGTPTIDIGTRQLSRYTKEEAPHVIHVETVEKDIVMAINQVSNVRFEPRLLFGEGESAKKFMSVINDQEFWNYPIQKQFIPR